MILRVILTFVASITFSILFSAPKKELFFCGLCGGLAWLLWELTAGSFQTDTLPLFIAASGATLLSRILAVKRRNPMTLYLTAGLIPLAPGSKIYYTMYYMLSNDTQTGVSYGVATLKAAGIICLAIMAVLALPRPLFSWLGRR